LVTAPSGPGPRPDDFNTQIQEFLARTNTRHHRRLGFRPTDRVDADRAAMLDLPPVPPVVGLAPQHPVVARLLFASGRWGEVYGDDDLAVAMIDRLVPHAEVIPSKATATNSNADFGRVPTAKTGEQ
jgi:hypothetical protein